MRTLLVSREKNNVYHRRTKYCLYVFIIQIHSLISTHAVSAHKTTTFKTAFKL